MRESLALVAAGVRASMTARQWLVTVLTSLPLFLVVGSGAAITGRLLYAYESGGIFDPDDGIPQASFAEVAGAVAGTVVAWSLIATLHRGLTIALHAQAGRTFGEAVQIFGAALGRLVRLGILGGALDAAAMVAVVHFTSRGEARAGAALPIAELAWWLLSRTSLGAITAHTTLTHDGLRAGWRDSERLMRGHRAALFLARCVVLGIAAVTAAVLAFPFYDLADADDVSGPRALAMLGAIVLIPAALVHVASIDAVVEGTLHARLSNATDARAIAKTFG